METSTFTTLGWCTLISASAAASSVLPAPQSGFRDSGAASANRTPGVPFSDFVFGGSRGVQADSGSDAFTVPSLGSLQPPVDFIFSVPAADSAGGAAGSLGSFDFESPTGVSVPLPTAGLIGLVGLAGLANQRRR